MTEQLVGENTTVASDGTIRTWVPVPPEQLEVLPGLEPVDVRTVDLTPEQAERIGSELLHAARRARRMRGEAV